MKDYKSKNKSSSKRYSSDGISYRNIVRNDYYEKGPASARFYDEDKIIITQIY